MTRPLPTLLRRLAALCLACAASACADTPRTVGGLQLGVEDAPLRPPVRIDDGTTFDYPPDAWDAGVGGTTVLRLLISRAGTVDSALVVQSSGNAALDSAALANAHRLRYEPAAQGGNPVPVWGRLPVVFPPPEPDMESPDVAAP